MTKQPNEELERWKLEREFMGRAACFGGLLLTAITMAAAESRDAAVRYADKPGRPQAQRP